MKKLLTSAAFVLALSGAAFTAQAANWVYLGQDKDDSIYYDAESLVRDGHRLSVTVQEREDDGDVDEYKYIFDTKGNRYTLTAKTEYDRFSQIKESEVHHDAAYRWKPVRENSDEEFILKGITK